MIKAAMMKGILWVAIPVSLLATAVSLFVHVGFPGTPGDSMPPDMGVASEAHDKNAPRKAAGAIGNQIAISYDPARIVLAY